MWLFLSDSFVSIIASRRPGYLVVRARGKDDIRRIFPGYAVHVGKGSDYKYRALISRHVVAKAIHDAVFQIS
jgi:hypothetical protein